MLDTRRLVVFRSVMASGTINAAAENLGYTPSAISQQLSALQRETGLTLFEKQGRGIIPTPAAHALLEHSAALMGQLAHLDAVVADLRSGRTGRLAIGYFASAGAVWMPSLVKQLARERPELTIELVMTEDPDPHSVDVDVDVVVDHVVPTPRAGFSRRHLVDDPYVLAVPADHPLAGLPVVSLADLSEEVLVSNDTVGSVCHQIVVNACESVGFAPRFSVQAQDYYTALGFVAVGVGISIIPTLCVQTLPPGVAVIPFAGVTPMRSIAVMRRAAAGPNPAAERAIQLLIEKVDAAA